MPKRPDKGEAVAPPNPSSSSESKRPFKKLLSRKEVLALLPEGVTYQTVWGWMEKELFPYPVELPNGGRIGWRDNEVYDALEQLPRRRPKGAKKR